MLKYLNLKQTVIKKGLFILLLTTGNWLAFNVCAQTIVFQDDFTGKYGTLKTSAKPSLTYVSNVPASTSDKGSASIYNRSMLLLNKGTTANLAYVAGSSSNFLSPYTTTLAKNKQAITWSFNLRYNRASRLSGTLSSGSPACAVVLACDRQNPAEAGAKGYGLFYLGAGSNGNTYNALYLIYFENGISGVSTGSGKESQTIIAKSAVTDIPANASANYLALKIVYDPNLNNWQLSYRVDADSFTDPTAGVFKDIAPVVNGTGTTIDMPYFAFASSYSATSGNAFFDNFKVFSEKQ